MSYYVIGNVYQGEGFTWIESEDEINFSELWKYSRHGEYETREKAEQISNELNERLK